MSPTQDTPTRCVRGNTVFPLSTLAYARFWTASEAARDDVSISKETQSRQSTVANELRRCANEEKRPSSACDPEIRKTRHYSSKTAKIPSFPVFTCPAAQRNQAAFSLSYRVMVTSIEQPGLKYKDHGRDEDPVPQCPLVI